MCCQTSGATSSALSPKLGSWREDLKCSSKSVVSKGMLGHMFRSQRERTQTQRGHEQRGAAGQVVETKTVWEPQFLEAYHTSSWCLGQWENPGPGKSRAAARMSETQGTTLSEKVYCFH